MTTAVPDIWDEFALVDVQIQSGTNQTWLALAEDVLAMDWGEKQIEVKPMIGGGDAVRKVPMTEEVLRLRLLPVSVGIPSGTTGTGVMQHFHPQAAEDSTQPLIVSNTRNRNKYRIVMLMSTTLPATAATVPAVGNPSYRIQVFNAYLTKATPNFDDKMMSVEVEFKWAPFQKDGTRNKIEESTDGSVVLDAVTSF